MATSKNCELSGFSKEKNKIEGEEEEEEWGKDERKFKIVWGGRWRWMERVNLRGLGGGDYISLYEILREHK